MILYDQCFRCGRVHRSPLALFRCRYGRDFGWLAGSGRYASVSTCPHNWPPATFVTVQLYPKREDAEKAKRTIDRTACGGHCCRRHFVLDLHTGQRLDGRN